jgi:hypothetical protein
LPEIQGVYVRAYLLAEAAWSIAADRAFQQHVGAVAQALDYLGAEFLLLEVVDQTSLMELR